MKVFIGYDPGESAAFAVCANSVIRHASVPISIIPLALSTMRNFYTETHEDGSTQFAYSRFLVPYLSGYTGMSLFLDGDMVVQADIADLFYSSGPNYDLWCVKHDYIPSSQIKFRGARQEYYPRKNWSSVMLFRNRAFTKLTPEYVSKATGSHLHRFEFMDEARIGELPKDWNWLVGEYEENNSAKILHYTLGIPQFPGYENCDSAQVWRDEFSIATLPHG